MSRPIISAVLPWLARLSLAVLSVVGVALCNLPVAVSSAQAYSKQETAPLPDEASPSSMVSSGSTFGSQVILERLWTTPALQGNANDARIVRLRPPDRVPPARHMPEQPPSPLAPAWQNSIRRVQPWDNRKVVALTFDLCERADDVTGYDAQIVHYLRTAHVRAAFFAGGKWLRSHPERAMQLMADPLFEVGNHGWTHGNLHGLTGQRLRDQIVWAQAQYDKIFGEGTGS